MSTRSTRYTRSARSAWSRHALAGRLLALAALAWCIAAPSAGDAAEAGPRRTYRIGMCPWIAWSPMHVADAEGMWKAMGLDVVVINQLGEAEHTAAIENREVDLGMDMIGNFVGMHQKGTPITILAELDWSHGGDKILVKDAKSPVKAGDTIGIYHHDPAVLMLLDCYLRSRKLALADVTLTEYEPEALTVHFIAGRLPCVLTYDPYALEVERHGGTAVATTATYPGCMPEGLAGRKDVLAGIPREDLAKIMRGWVMAAEWSRQPGNWSRYVEILNEHTFADPEPYGEAAIRTMLGNVRIHDPQALRERNGQSGGLRQSIGQMRQMLSEAKLLKKDFSAADLVDTSVLLEVLDPVATAAPAPSR